MKFNCQYFNSTLQNGVRNSAFRDFSQIERFAVKWDNTDPVSCVLLIELGGFFKSKKILPRQTVEELNGGASQDAKHQMAHDFSSATDADKERAEIVFKLGVDALDGTALLETLRARRVHWDFFCSSRIEVNDGNMSELSGKGVDFFGVVSGVHEVVEIGDARLSQLCQGDRRLGVVEGGGSQDSTDGQIPIDDIKMEFVAVPRFGEALCVALATVVAKRGQIGQILGQGSLRLKLQSSELFGFKRLIFCRTSSLPGNFRYGKRFSCGLFASGNRGGITADMSHEFGSKILLNHGGMDFLRQMKISEGGKGTGEGGFGGDFRGGFPSTESAQGRTVLEVIQESASGGEIPNGFGNERLGHRQAIFGFCADKFPLKRSHEALRMTEVCYLDEALFFIRKRTDFLLQHGEELALDDEGGGGKVVHKKTFKNSKKVLDYR